MGNLFPHEVFRIGPIALTDSALLSALVSLLLAGGGGLAIRTERGREVLEVIYEFLERLITDAVNVDARPLVPLVLTQWLFIVAANLVGLLPGLASPTRDLSLASALAAIAWVASHVFAAREQGLGYLRRYAVPHPLMLPLNLIGEASRMIALALRLFGNMLSSTLIGAVVLYLAGFLVPVPLMLLGVLTSVVQAYIFGALTLVFSASALKVAADGPAAAHPEKGASG